MTHPKALPKKSWQQLFLPWLAIFLLAAAPALAETLEVTRPNTHLFESPSFGSESLGEVPVGEKVEVKSRSGEWLEVDIDGETGWIHQTAFPQGPVQLPRLHSQAPVPETTSTEIAVAGKGFTPEVETGYREKNPTLNYAQVDQIEAFRLSPSQVTGFIQAGQLLAVSGGAVTGCQGFSATDEYYLGRAVAANILAKYPLYQNQALTRYVNLVGQAVAQKYRSATSRGFHFAVLDASEPNAFACPGGIILVTRGLIKSCQNEDELAAVLAHEVGHVVHHDGLKSIQTAQKTEKRTRTALRPLKAAKWAGAAGPGFQRRLRRQMAGKGAKTAASSVAGSFAAGSLVDLFEDSINDAVKTIMVNGYSRGSEEDADREAVSLMACTGYNPGALTAFLDHLSSTGSENAGMFRTHPSTSSRVARVKSLVVQAKANPGEQTRTSRFQQAAL
jgi:Zn-dependent protease with chaperone function